MNYHFIGIGGVSMKALSEVCLYLGNNVSGSDKNDENFDKLNKLGIKTSISGNLDLVNRADVIVYSSSINDDDLELQEAKRLKKKILKRAEYLNEVSKLVKENIIISGAHGKSSTTSIIARSLNNSHYGLIGHQGADYIDRESSLIFSGFDFLVSEGCEYKKNFLYLKPDVLVITNIDYDHPDSYLNEIELKEAFISLANKSKVVIINEKEEDVINRLTVKYLTFGEKENSNYYFKVINKDKASFLVEFYKDKKVVLVKKIFTNLYFNLYNFIAAFAAMDNLKTKTILKKIELDNQIYLKRRNEIIGCIKDTKIILDYAHHPKEIDLLIEEYKKIYNKILVIFEPHTYSRTLALFDEFLSVFCKIENLYLLPTFASREIAAKDPIIKMYECLDKDRVTLLRCLEDGYKIIKEKGDEYDLILLIGAGDIYKIVKLINMDKTVNSEQ